MAESGDGPIVRREPPYQPERFEIAMAGALKEAGRPYLIQIAPDIQAKHIARMISGPSGCSADRAIEAQPDKIKAANEFIDDADQSIGSNRVLDGGWR